MYNLYEPYVYLINNNINIERVVEVSALIKIWTGFFSSVKLNI